jgi:hypothetical protein
MSSREDKPRAVPKFGSFKPKAPAKDDTGPKPDADVVRTGPEAESRGVKRLKSHHRHRDEDRNHRRLHGESSHEKHHGKYPSQESSRLPSRTPRPPEPIRETKPGGEELFTLDKRGDPLIVRYRGNDRSRVPPYRRIRRGILLGSNGSLEMHQDGPREYFTIRNTREGRSAFRDKSLLALAGRTRSRFFKNSTKQAALTADEEFIALEPLNKREREDDEDGESASDRERQSYRSIEGKAKAHEDSDSAFASDSEDQTAEEYYVTPAKRRAIELSRTVKERPNEAQVWLELIDFQDVLFKENEDPDHVRTRDETKALADIKVSMFEKALQHAVQNEDREGLLVGLMREGSRVWRTDKLARRWAEVTEQHPDSFALWRSRVDFELSNIASFSFDDIKRRFVDRLRFLESKISGTGDAEEDQCHLAEQAMYVFLRLTRFLQEAGFLDLAVGAWQALLELHFARAPLAENSRESSVASLREFWDSEVPRIGEAGAMGWRKFVNDGGVGELPGTNPLVTRSSPQTSDPYEAWAITEAQQTLEARLPAKTVDEEPDDDPYRVVMFADIEPFVVIFPARTSNVIRKQLLDAFLLFCHLPPAFGLHGTDLESAIDDSFVYGGSRSFERSLHKMRDAVDMSGERKRQLPDFKQDGSRIAVAPEILVSGRNWFEYLTSWLELYPEHDEPLERSYVLTTMRQLVRTFGFEELAEYHLALEWVNDPTVAKKVAKGVLKQYPSNTGLYNAYALVEFANGNIETSRKVLQSAIGQGLAKGTAGQMLRNTWAWIELDAKHHAEALGPLCSADEVGNPPATPALVLKARSLLAAQRDSLLSATRPHDALHYATSLAFLGYLSPTDGETSGKEPQSADQGNITAAMNACNAFSSELVSRGLQQSPVHERFLQFAARLIYYHATHGLAGP